MATSKWPTSHNQATAIAGVWAQCLALHWRNWNKSSHLHKRTRNSNKSRRHRNNKTKWVSCLGRRWKEYSNSWMLSRYSRRRDNCTGRRCRMKMKRCSNSNCNKINKINKRNRYKRNRYNKRSHTTYNYATKDYSTPNSHTITITFMKT